MRSLILSAGGSGLQWIRAGLRTLLVGVPGEGHNNGTYYVERKMISPAGEPAIVFQYHSARTYSIDESSLSEVYGRCEVLGIQNPTDSP